MSENETDVVVVGARCAGAATAMLLARRGYRVTVVERGRIPSDTLSTHGIARGGVVRLARWGLTIDAVKAQPEPAEFQFRATNRWISGTHNESTINGYRGAGQEHDRGDGHRYDADHPPVLTGGDAGPTPVEFLLHALAACLTSGLANIAAARGIEPTEVTSTVEAISLLT